MRSITSCARDVFGSAIPTTKTLLDRIRDAHYSATTTCDRYRDLASQCSRACLDSTEFLQAMLVIPGTRSPLKFTVLAPINNITRPQRQAPRSYIKVKGTGGSDVRVRVRVLRARGLRMNQ